MSYRGSLLTRIAGTVLIAFAWFGFLFVYLTFLSSPDVSLDLGILLAAGLVDAAGIASLWIVWFVRDRESFRRRPPQDQPP